MQQAQAAVPAQERIVIALRPEFFGLFKAVHGVLKTHDQRVGLVACTQLCFGPPLKSPYKRWKKSMAEITSWNKFDPAQYKTAAEIDAWITETRHKVMYRDATNID